MCLGINILKPKCGDIRNTSELSSKVLDLEVERFSRGIRRSIASKISIWMVCLTTWSELEILILKRNSPLVVTPILRNSRKGMA